MDQWEEKIDGEMVTLDRTSTRPSTASNYETGTRSDGEEMNLQGTMLTRLLSED